MIDLIIALGSSRAYVLYFFCGHRSYRVGRAGLGGAAALQDDSEYPCVFLCVRVRVISCASVGVQSCVSQHRTTTVDSKCCVVNPLWFYDYYCCCTIILILLLLCLPQKQQMWA